MNPAMRGRNIGSGVVERLLELYPGKLVILENRTSAGEMAVRRASFYERLRIRSQSRTITSHRFPTVKGTDACPHELVLMSHGALRPERILRIYGVHAGSHLGVYAD